MVFCHAAISCVWVGPLHGERTQDGLGQGALGILGHRHEVGPAQLEELDPVFQQPQVAVRVVEGRGVRPADVTAGGQRGDGGGGVPATK